MFKLKRANDGKYKYIVYYLVDDKYKIIKFGAYGYEDYTTHHDENRKQRYINRHRANENWNNKLSKGFWSRWLLWNKHTIKESLKDIEHRFGLKRI